MSSASTDSIPADHPLRKPPQQPVAAVLSLGANIGEPQKALAYAVNALRNHPHINLTGISPVAYTQPVGGVEQPKFYNQTITLITDLSAVELLEFGQELEHDQHRVREQRWGPRTLDIDVIDYNNLRSDHPALTLPHPRAHERGFVLVPWAWIDPDAVLAGRSVAKLATETDDAATVQRADQ